MPKPIFKKIAIIGIGLIGSSLARAIQQESLAETLVCADKNADYLQKSQDLKLVDYAYPDAAQAVEGADLVILAVPISAMQPLAATIAPALAEGAIVTDVGSVKQAVIRDIAPLLPPYVHFIPAHPIAGTENSGPEAGYAALFKGRWAIITPLPDTEATAQDKLCQFWSRIGSNVEIMSPERHDRVLAITSHLPHLIAYTIVSTAADLEEDMKSDVIKYSAGGFRDFTRIAGSDPTMWRDIFINNQAAILEIAQRFTEDVTALQRSIRRNEGEALFDLFTRARAIRRGVVDAKQA